MNDCVFSQDREYRYVLTHRWDELFPERPCMWIGLNPSVADEHGLDNTLTRIRAFSTAAGFTSFYMTNLFALVSTDPEVMKKHPEPVGPENNWYIKEIAQRVSTIFVAWGIDGKHLGRDVEVLRLLKGSEILCLKMTKDGFPGHPLYLAGAIKPIKFDPSVRFANA